MADVGVTPIVALDFPSQEPALALVDRLGRGCSFYKVGSELFTAAGRSVLGALRERDKAVFLDLKFHDIPNTVRGAVRSAAAAGARLVTVHASGGRAMLEAAAEGAASQPSGASMRCKVLAVSVLTSLDAPALAEAWGRREVEVEAEVLRLARLARDSGIDGLVCSAREAGLIRRELGPRFEVLVPGIRLPGTGVDDQARAATPAAAAEAGATYIVLGRTVTGDADPVAAMARVQTQLRPRGAPEA